MKLRREFIRCEYVECKFNYEKHCKKDHVTVISNEPPEVGDTVVKAPDWRPHDCRDYEMSRKRKG